MKVNQWQCCEIGLKDSGGQKNLFPGITAVFTGPSGKTITREAFWNGGDDYIVRFAPTEEGLWHYTVTGLSGGEETGSLECTAYGGDLPLYRHGFLRASDDGRYLCHQDGTPFFWLGDTHWQFAVAEKWDESNDPRFDSQFRAIVDRRVEQRFNVYQCNFHCDSGGGYGNKHAEYFYKEGGQWVPNLEFLKNDLDQKMGYLADKGFCIAAGFSWCFSIMAPDAIEYYQTAARYLIARYGAYPMIWTLAGEVGGYSEDMRQAFIDKWREIAFTVEKCDSYGHLQTAHYTNERPFAGYYQDESWFDFTLNQAGHGDYPIDCRPFREHRAKFPRKPFVESESMYEDVLTLEPNGRRRATPYILRRVAYLAMQNGACGYTYGAQGMWHLQWDEPDSQKLDLGFGACQPWHAGIDFPGAYQMGTMRKFYEEVDFQRLRPVSRDRVTNKTENSFVLTLSGDEFDALFTPSVTADENMETVVAYYTEVNRYCLCLTGLTAKTYSARWFDPESGEYADIGSVTPENGEWTAPVKPTASDIILLLTAADSMES